MLPKGSFRNDGKITAKRMGTDQINLLNSSGDVENGANKLTDPIHKHNVLKISDVRRGKK